MRSALKTKQPPASLSFKGQVAEEITVKWSIRVTIEPTYDWFSLGRLKTFTGRKMFRCTFYGIKLKTIQQEIFDNQLYEKTEFEATVHIAIKPYESFSEFVV